MGNQELMEIIKLHQKIYMEYCNLIISLHSINKEGFSGPALDRIVEDSVKHVSTLSETISKKFKELTDETHH